MTRRHLTPKEHRMWMRVQKTIKPMEEAQARATPTDEPKLDEQTIPLRPSRQPTVTSPQKRGRGSATPDDLARLAGGFSPSPSTGIPSKPTRPHAIKGEPANRGQEKRVRRGRVPFGSTLDLHGHTQDTGRSTLLSFLSFHRGSGETSVLVITGKGKDGQGILRRRFLEWLAEPDFRGHVSGYARANQKHGGDGAFYVFLRRLGA